MDDLDPTTAQMLTAYIKDWTDRYAFKAERKGGSLYPEIKQFFITTQYTLEQLWPNAFGEPNVDRDAIMRRCKVITFEKDPDGRDELPSPNNWHQIQKFKIGNAPKWVVKSNDVNLDYN